MTIREAMIVAGGRGTRLQPLTFTTPKPLLPFCGAPFLAGVIARLAAVGVRRVFLVVGTDTAPFDSLRGPAAALDVEVVCVPEPEPLDTAGGVRAALDQVSDTFLALNGDILTDVDFAAAVRAHRDAGADATIVLTRVDDTTSFGVCVRDGTRIVDFVEKPPAGTLPGQDTVNAGTYVLEPEVLAAFPSGPLSFERQVFPGILAQGGHLEGYVWEGVWADLGTPERYLEGTQLALAGALHWPTVQAVPDLGDGIRIQDGAHVDPAATVTGPALVLAGATIEAGAVVGPGAVIGHRAHVHGGVRVVRSILFEDVIVMEGATAEQLIAGTGAAIGAGASLGRDVVLGDGQTVAGGQEVPCGTRLPEPTD